MSFEREMTSADNSLSKTLKELFEDFEYESDAEETFAVESVPVPSDDILAINLRGSMCNKHKLLEPGDTSGKRRRLMEPGELTDSESDDENTTTLIGQTDPVPSNNILAANLQGSACNKRKGPELGDTPEKKRRQMGPGEMKKSIDGGGDVEYTQTAMLSPRALDGTGDRQLSLGDDVSAVDGDDFLPGYSMDKVNFTFWNMYRLDQEVVVPGKSVKIGDVRTVFEHRSWLNDEVISGYMQLIADRDPCKVYAFNTCFYPMLSLCGYDAVSSWEFTNNIFDYDRVLIPIHEKLHWTLVCVDFNDKTIKHYDSLGRNNLQCLKLVLDYLKMESRKTIGNEFNSDEWQLLHAEDCPKQLNLDDCGVFTCLNAEYLARGVKPNFVQSDIPKFRLRISYEILTDRLLLGLDGSRPRPHN